MLKVKFISILACNQLMAYAASLKGQAQYLAENQNNLEKL